MQPTDPPRFAGIDVSKAKLDVAVDKEPVFTIPNTPEGHTALVERLAPLGLKRRSLTMRGNQLEFGSPT